MEQLLRIEIPDELYAVLSELATKLKSTPEKVAAEWLKGRFSRDQSSDATHVTPEVVSATQ